MANRFSISSSSLTSGYSSLVDESFEFLEQESEDSVSNQVQLEWTSDDVLLVTKANSSVIIFFSIFKLEDTLRCEYFRYEKPETNLFRLSRNTSQSRCDQLQANRQIALLTSLKFYKDFLKNSQKTITIYTDLLRSTLGRKSALLIQDSHAGVKVLHHHQHDGGEETQKYNQCYQAARNLLEDDVPGFKNSILQLGGIEFHRIK